MSEPGRPSLRTLFAEGWRSRRPFTLLSVGCVSDMVIEATLQVCASQRVPAILAASRNQVDVDGGYLREAPVPAALVARVAAIRKTLPLPVAVHVCRDHGGPWQRNGEVLLTVDEAMAAAKKSLHADIAAGFDYLHLDLSQAPGTMPVDERCARIAELLSDAEEFRAACGAPPVEYEVGIEHAGVRATDAAAFRAFLQCLASAIARVAGPMPAAVVAHTGAYVSGDRNHDGFDTARVSELVAIARSYGLALKEHHSDYLTPRACRNRPAAGVGGCNIGPVAARAETSAYLRLCRASGRTSASANRSEFESVLESAVLRSTPWRKWFPRRENTLTGAQRRSIVMACGHYAFGVPEVRHARRALFAEAEKLGITPDAAEYVRASIRRQLRLYMGALGLLDRGQLPS